jgi:diacylglycerol kinase (ATP)
MRYDIHVTRWERDALCVAREHAEKAKELLRIHVMGGTGTFSEVINGIVTLPNIQIASYPFGNENTFLQYFGVDKVHLFSSIRSQVYSDTTPLDVIRCGHKYAISHGLVGFEAAVGREGAEMYDKRTIFHQGAAYIIAAVKTAFGNWMLGQNYSVDVDGKKLDGIYISMLIANGPCYSRNMSPAVDAHPNDGFLDIYLTKKMPRVKFMSIVRKYLSGNYFKIPEYIEHYKGKKISVSSETVMSVYLDDKPSYVNSIGYEVLPYAVDFVCPGGIDIDKLTWNGKRGQNGGYLFKQPKPYRNRVYRQP